MGPCPRDILDVHTLAEHHITAILNLQSDNDFASENIDWGELESLYREFDILVRRVPVIDLHPADMLRLILLATSTLKSLIDNHHRVYVHCTAGRERSPTTTVCYLAWYEQMGMDAALNFVKEIRRCNPYLSILEDANDLFYSQDK